MPWITVTANPIYEYLYLIRGFVNVGFRITSHSKTISYDNKKKKLIEADYNLPGKSFFLDL